MRNSIERTNNVNLQNSFLKELCLRKANKRYSQERTLDDSRNIKNLMQFGRASCEPVNIPNSTWVPVEQRTHLNSSQRLNKTILAKVLKNQPNRRSLNTSMCTYKVSRNTFGERSKSISTNPISIQTTQSNLPSPPPQTHPSKLSSSVILSKSVLSNSKPKIAKMGRKKIYWGDSPYCYSKISMGTSTHFHHT